MKKTWNSPVLTELTIKATEHKGGNGYDGGSSVSPDEFHPERFMSCTMPTATPSTGCHPSIPGGNGKPGNGKPGGGRFF